MALTLAKFVATLNWTQKLSISGFPDRVDQGALNCFCSPTVDGTHATDAYYLSGTLGIGASITLNLNALTQPQFGTSIVSTRGYIIVLKCTGATWKYSPGAVLGLAWFLSGTTPAMNGSGDTSGSGFAYWDATAATIDNGNKNVTISNTSGSNTLTYTLALILGA